MMAALPQRIPEHYRAMIEFSPHRLVWIVIQGGMERGAFIHLHHAQAEAEAWEQTGPWSEVTS